MKQVVNIRFRNKALEKIMKTSREPHITLVYPFEKVNQKKLFRHISNIAMKAPKFKLVLKGHMISEGGSHIYLLVSKGEGNIMQLYKKLNSGPLKGFENKKIPRYIPHISLAKFRNKKRLHDFKKQMEKLNIKIEIEVKSITLLTIRKNGSIFKKRSFRLK